MIRAAGIVAAALALLTASSAQALTLTQVGGTFAQPTYVTSEPGSADRLFVAERKGTIRLLKGGLSSQFADISAAVGCGGSCAGERGLMSLAPDPDFAANGRLYVAYANDEDGAIHVASLLATAPAYESAPAATLEDLLVVPHPDESNHNGGQIQFGPDGFLYLSTGDGGGRDDEFHNAQDPASQLGKILRIDPEAPEPATVWSLGLRNPYRFSFDRLTGDMVIGDVGQSAREEIDFAPSPLPGVVGGFGANYGWNCREGLLPGPATDPECATLPLGAFTPPVFEYGHDADPDLAGSPARCSITGGYVVRDPALGALYGRYLYSDYCGGGLRALRLPGSADGRSEEDCSLKLRAVNPVSFGEDAARRLYVVEQGGRIYRLGGEPPASCPPPPPAAPPQAPPAPARVRAAEPTVPSYVGIQAQRRRVERGRRALLTVWVSPCNGRRGQLVQLRRNGNPFGSRYLSRACTARFLPKIRGATSFAATIRADETHLPAESRQLKIKLAPPQRR